MILFCYVYFQAWVHSNRWDKHADMLVQYAQCLRRNLPHIRNMSVYVDVWCSLNGRFQQRMFDPSIDLLTVEWSPFQEVSWLMPLLTELSSWRETMSVIEKDVYSWSNFSDVLFVADFPGMCKFYM